MKSLHPFMMEMSPIPGHLDDAIRKGVVRGSFPEASLAAEVFQQWDQYADQVIRADNGQILVTCTTALPGVTPSMIDWWFGWHLTDSDRYRLWHPKAHVKCRVKEDRSAWVHDREKYIGNVSYVDEYIGRKLRRLAIAFLAPEEFGLGNIDKTGATAVCARTSDRLPDADAGHLIHLVSPTASGSQMRSAFWLGHLNLNWPVIGPLLKPVLNTKFIRRFFVSDRMALELFRHCAEEMHHLPRFLPALYRTVHEEPG